MGLRRSALLLAAAGAVEYGLQLAIPVVLVRHLDPGTFGQYRYLWLLAASSLAIAPLFMPQALFYFLPRYGERKGAVVGNVLAYLLFASCVTALIVSLLGFGVEAAHQLFQASSGLSSVFVGLWVLAAVVDVLPTADGRAPWQANATVLLAVLRAVLLTASALLAPQIVWIVAALVSVALFKCTAAGVYLWRMDARPRLTMNRQLFAMQLRYALPFAAGNALFLLRVQADQWVVATVADASIYAVFSIASALMPVATLLRQPVYNAMMPRLNSAYASADYGAVAALLKRTNGTTATLLIPVAACLIATAPELVALVYTPAYASAVAVMQVYLLGMMMNAFAVGHVLPGINKGRFAAINNGCCLLGSVILSYAGLRLFGLVGAALGSVCMFAVSELWSASTVARALGVHFRALIAWRALVPPVLGAFSGIACAYAAAAGSSYGSAVSHLVIVLLLKSIGFTVGFVTVFVATGGFGHARRLFLRAGSA